MAAGYPSLSQLSRSKLHRILTQCEVKPHKVRYYVERRDPAFEKKMVEVEDFQSAEFAVPIIESALDRYSNERRHGFHK